MEYLQPKAATGPLVLDKWLCLVVSSIGLKQIQLNMKSLHERTGLEDALDKQVSKSNLLSACIAQSIESLRRNRLGPGSTPAQPRFFFFNSW